MSNDLKDEVTYDHRTHPTTRHRAAQEGQLTSPSRRGRSRRGRSDTRARRDPRGCRAARSSQSSSHPREPGTCTPRDRTSSLPCAAPFEIRGPNMNRTVALIPRAGEGHGLYAHADDAAGHGAGRTRIA